MAASASLTPPMEPLVPMADPVAPDEMLVALVPAQRHMNFGARRRRFHAHPFRPTPIPSIIVYSLAHNFPVPYDDVPDEVIPDRVLAVMYDPTYFWIQEHRCSLCDPSDADVRRATMMVAFGALPRSFQCWVEYYMRTRAWSLVTAMETVAYIFCADWARSAGEVLRWRPSRRRQTQTEGRRVANSLRRAQNVVRST